MIVFDDCGYPWTSKTGALQRVLRSTLGGRALALYTVVNLGFIAAEQSSHGVTIRLRPAAASGAALAGLFYWLCTQRMSRVVVSSFENMDWRYALMGSRDEAMAYLSLLHRA